MYSFIHNMANVFCLKKKANFPQNSGNYHHKIWINVTLSVSSCCGSSSAGVPNPVPEDLPICRVQFQPCSSTTVCNDQVLLKILMSWFRGVWSWLDLNCRKVDQDRHPWSSGLWTQEHIQCKWPRKQHHHLLKCNKAVSEQGRTTEGTGTSTSVRSVNSSRTHHNQRQTNTRSPGDREINTWQSSLTQDKAWC